MNEQTYTRPGAVTAIGIITLLSGIVNVIWGTSVGLHMAGNVFLLCLTPIFVAQLALGVYEIVYASKLLYNPPQPVRPAPTVAVLEIATVLVLNIFSLIAGILALVFYNDPQVKAYFARLNGAPALPPAAAAEAENLPPVPAAGEAPPEAPAEAPAPRTRRKARSPKNEQES